MYKLHIVDYKNTKFKTTCNMISIKLKLKTSSLGESATHEAKLGFQNMILLPTWEQ